MAPLKIMMSAANSPVAPSIIKHLKSLGHFVIGHDACGAGAGARLCDMFDVSPPAAKHLAYAAYLRSVTDCVHSDIYLPFLDEELMIFSPTDIAELKVVCSSAGILKIFTSKVQQQQAMKNAGLPVAPRAVGPPCIIKRDLGRGGRHVWQTDSVAMFDLMRHSSGHVVQRYIEGDEFTIDVLVGKNEELIRAIPRRRIVANGVSVVGQIKMDNELVELAREVTESFPFCGPINIQAIRERATGKLFIMEINPRLSGSCIFTVRAGFDILDATVKLFTGQPLPPPGPIREATFCRHYEETEL